jgi:asparagine synthase (glutamine-hydrolysing)
MNNAPALQTTNRAFSQYSSRWLATLGTALPADEVVRDFSVLRSTARTKTLSLAHSMDSSPPTFAERPSCAAVFDGSLFNQADLKHELGFSTTTIINDSQLILEAFNRWGDQSLKRLRGAFALLLWDKHNETLFCLRDPLGTYPLFYAEHRQGISLSTSIDTLIRHPGVPGTINRAALADYFLDRFPRLEETFFEGINRVPPGHVLRVSAEGRTSYRYWDPAPEGTVDWLSPEEVDRFDEVLERSVNRCLSLGPTAIFLSGGLDSVSVAAVAVEQSLKQNSQRPLALSLVFPEPGLSEEIIQRGVAGQLEMSHVVKPFHEMCGSDELIRPAMKLSRTLASPLTNIWLPAYVGLAAEAWRRGYRTILTGNGGDEWLTVSPYLAADLLRDVDFRGLYQLAGTFRRSHARSKLAIMRMLLWTFGAKPLLLSAAHGVIKKTAPSVLRLRRHYLPNLPKWLVPDPALRKELKLRREEYAAKKQKTAVRSRYLQEGRVALDHPLISWELEEYFEAYQRSDMRLLHPFWDPDLIELLYRTPPSLLNRDGRNKGLVRACLARKFPKLGFERQVKLEATSFYISSVKRESRTLWNELGSARLLEDLGIVDYQRLSPDLERQMDAPRTGLDAHRVWTVLNLESWARAHVS